MGPFFGKCWNLFCSNLPASALNFVGPRGWTDVKVLALLLLGSQ